MHQSPTHHYSLSPKINWNLQYSLYNSHRLKTNINRRSKDMKSPKSTVYESHLTLSGLMYLISNSEFLTLPVRLIASRWGVVFCGMDKFLKEMIMKNKSVNDSATTFHLNSTMKNQNVPVKLNYCIRCFNVTLLCCDGLPLLGLHAQILNARCIQYAMLTS